MDKERTVKHKSLEFAKRIVSMYKYLSAEKNEYVLSKQLLKNGTSIGTNIAEAACGISKKDFLSKMYIAFKECAETEYWIELLFSCDFINQKEYDSIKNDCKELMKMLSSITKTTNSSLLNSH